MLGSHLLKKLIRQGEQVRAIYRSEKSLKKTKSVFRAHGVPAYFHKIEWIEADLLDLMALEKAFEGVSKVYHCAAMVSFRSSDASQMMKVNIDGTANMVNLALAKKIEKFAYASSVAALGKYPDQRCSDEASIWQKEKYTSEYSISKFYAENEVWRAAEEGLQMIIINPSTILGFGAWEESSNALFKKVNDGLPFYPPGSNGFVGVEDVAESMIQLMESSISQERFLISAENISYKTLFSKIAGSLHKKAPGIPLKKWQAKLYLYWENIIAFLKGKAADFTEANLRSAFALRCFNHQKIKSRLNFEFTPLDKVIAKSGKMYLENKVAK